MDVLIYLIPIALGMGAIGLGAFLWTLKSGQYDDLDGAANRILMNDDDRPLPDPVDDQADADGPDDVHKS